jgi:hypothetical protein
MSLCARTTITTIVYWFCACIRRELAGEAGRGNLHFRFDEGR